MNITVFTVFNSWQTLVIVFDAMLVGMQSMGAATVQEDEVFGVDTQPVLHPKFTPALESQTLGQGNVFGITAPAFVESAPKSRSAAKMNLASYESGSLIAMPQTQAVVNMVFPVINPRTYGAITAIMTPISPPRTIPMAYPCSCPLVCPGTKCEPA